MRYLYEGDSINKETFKNINLLREYLNKSHYFSTHIPLGCKHFFQQIGTLLMSILWKVVGRVSSQFLHLYVNLKFIPSHCLLQRPRQMIVTRRQIWAVGWTFKSFQMKWVVIAYRKSLSWTFLKALDNDQHRCTSSMKKVYRYMLIESRQ